MNSVIELYSYMLSIQGIASKIDVIECQEFVDREEIVSAYYAIFKELIKYLVKLDERLILHTKLNILVKEIYETDRFMLNSYKMLNANMLYDFFKVDYKKLVNIVVELMK